MSEEKPAKQRIQELEEALTEAKKLAELDAQEQLRLRASLEGYRQEIGVHQHKRQELEFALRKERQAFGQLLTVHERMRKEAFTWLMASDLSHVAGTYGPLLRKEGDDT